MSADAKNTRVKVKQGELQGTLENLQTSGTYYSFKGIPYAKPPLGDLRFKGPQPPENWSGVRDASNHGHICPQMDALQLSVGTADEDCLTLNVYTPTLKGSKMPVMVWFHGGAFLSGSSNSEVYGPEHLMEEGVVVVTANYRLEVLGFLCLDTEDVPGNAGLKDQVAVLKWVRDNILNFCGDPGNVTIFGESAGGASAAYHILSPMSKGLFHKVIAQSGCCLNAWALLDGKEVAFRAAKALGLESENVNEAAKLFKNVETDKLVGLTQKIKLEEDEIRSLAIYFCPTVDKNFDGEEAFLPKPPMELLAEGNFNKVPVILGYCSAEGLLFMKNVKKEGEKIFETLTYRTPKILRNTAHPEELKIIDEKIRKFYFADEFSVDNLLTGLTNLESDVMFSYHITNMSKILPKVTDQPVYLYRFNYVGLLNIPKTYMGMLDRPGACHADDLFYLFNNAHLSAEKDTDEWHLMKRMCKMWSNFAKYNNPTPEKTDLLPLEWKPVTKTETNFLNIDSEITLDVNPDKERFEFWDKIYDDFYKSHHGINKCHL